MMESCCYNFKRRLELINDRGLSIEPTGREKAPYKIVMRTIEKKEEENFMNEIKKNNFKINHTIFEEMRIKYCPWCGKDLKITT